MASPLPDRYAGGFCVTIACKNITKRSGAKFEYRAKVTADKQTVNEASTENPVADAIVYEGGITLLFKSMFVNPPSIRAFLLLIDKSIRRLPRSDRRSPTQRNPMNAQPLVDPCSLAHFDGAFCEDVEVQGRWCDPLQVAGVCKEGEDILAGPRHAHARTQQKAFTVI